MPTMDLKLKCRWVCVALVVFVVGEAEHVGAIFEREGCLRESRYVHAPDGHVVAGYAFVRRPMNEAEGLRKIQGERAKNLTPECERMGFWEA